MDGTLLNSRLEVSQRVRTTLQIAEGRAEFILTSGRPAVSCLNLARDLLQHPKFVIASNGATIIDCRTEKVIYEARFSSGSASVIASIARRAAVALCVYHPKSWYANSADKQTIMEVSRSGVEPIYVNNVEEYLDGAIKLLMIGDPGTIVALRPVVGRVPDVNSFVSYPEYLEVMPSSVSKAAAAQIVKERLAGSSETLTMAIGDGEADISLFETVDVPIAVDNAIDEVRQTARFVAPSNDYDGVAIALEAFVQRDAKARASLWTPRRDK